MNSVQTMVLVQALNGMEIEIERGQTLGLVGETGAGKTTTGLSLLRLIPDPPGVIVSGSIKLDGKDILARWTRRRCRNCVVRLSP